MSDGWNSGPVIVLDTPKRQRRHLVSLGDGPWLQPQPPRRAWLPVLVLLAVGLFAQHRTATMALVLGSVAVGIGLMTWACAVHRRHYQVCPECLADVGLGARVCHCGFRAQRAA